MPQYSSQPPGPQSDADAWQALLNQANQLSPAPAPNMSVPQPAPPPPDPKRTLPALHPYMAQAPVEQSMMGQYKDQLQKNMLDQTNGLNQLDQYIKGIQDKPQGINWTPLAAYVDSQNPHSKMLEAAKAMAPMTPEQKDQMVFELQNKLQGGRNALSKDSLQALGDQMRILHQQKHDADEKAHWNNMDDAALQRTDASGQRVLNQKDAQGQRAADLFDKDTLTTTLLTRYNQIGIDRHTLEHSDVVPAQMMAEMSTGLAAALTGSKAVGVEATKMQQLASLEGDIAKLQSYAGKPMNSLTDDQRAYLQTTFSRLENAYANAINDRKDWLRNGRDFAYNPHANKIMDAKAQHIPVNETKAAPGAVKEGDTQSYQGANYKVVGGHWVEQK